MDSDGLFRVLASDPIPMDHHSDKIAAITHNAEKVLKVAEGFIEQAPYQWVMFYPVWPSALEMMP
jgi:lauroyl/myristoyl acyltransferase